MEWLNYHHLLYFWVVAREGGLAPAGKILRLSHPTLSGQIRKLEEALGLALFEKQGRRLHLTEMGRIAFRYADEIFGLGREMQDVLRRTQVDRPQRLVVGISDVVPKLLVRTLLGPALAGPGTISLVCQEDSFDRLLTELANHDLDVVIADAPVPPASPFKLYNHILGTTDVTLVGPPAMARSVRREFPASLDGAPLLLPLEGSTLRRNLDAWFTSIGVRPRLVAEAEDSALLKEFAADGMGLTFVPTIVASIVTARYHLAEAGRVDGIKERYYAISAERRLIHPAVLAIRDAAREDVFARLGSR
jgi:LysR family transcriptional activator of nhaA